MNGIMWFILICVLLIPVTMWFIVYRDAKARGMEAVLWAFIAALVPSFIGLILYLIISRSHVTNKCPECSHIVKNDFTICPYCSASLKKSCPQCSEPLEWDWNTCPKCGEKQEVGAPPVALHSPRGDTLLWVLLLFLIGAPVVILLLLIFKAHGII